MGYGAILAPQAAGVAPGGGTPVQVPCPPSPSWLGLAHQAPKLLPARLHKRTKVEARPSDFADFLLHPIFWLKDSLLDFFQDS